MKAAKLIIGIISIVLFGLITFQSCAAGFLDILADTGEASGATGMFAAICYLIAGIIGIVTRNGIAGGFVAGAFYAVGGIIGITNYGIYGDLIIWSILSFIFALVFIIGGIASKGAMKKYEDSFNNENTNNKNLQ